MIRYTVYNKQLARPLRYPKDVLWTTTSLKEATDMLDVVRQYVGQDLGVPEFESNFMVIDAEVLA